TARFADPRAGAPTRRGRREVARELPRAIGDYPERSDPLEPSPPMSGDRTSARIDAWPRHRAREELATDASTEGAKALGGDRFGARQSKCCAFPDAAATEHQIRPHESRDPGENERSGEKGLGPLLGEVVPRGSLARPPAREPSAELLELF